MVRVEKIPDSSGRGFTLAIVGEDVERVNPIEYYRTLWMVSNMAKRLEYLKMQWPLWLVNNMRAQVKADVAKSWDDYYAYLMAKEIPSGLLSALKTDNKKYQEKFLRGLQFTPEQLKAFYFKAYLDYGYTLSVYDSEYLPAGTDIADMPTLVNVDGDRVLKVGNTPLKDGELKQAVLQRSAIYGKILDNGETWHCFFITIESIAGKENWKGGQPHYHYISDKFGVPREEVVKQLQSKDYKLFNLPHLELLDYGGPGAKMDEDIA